MESTATPSLYGERGAGGKLRKPPARKPPSTPYDRPPSTTSNRGWLSKLVDPAYRLLADGTAKILPSFFSKSPTALPPPSGNNDLDDRDSEVAPIKEDDAECAASHAAFTSSKGTPSEVPDRLKRISEVDELGRGKMNSSSTNSGTSRIEQLIEGRTFSRDEINHLKEILNSRILDISEVEKEGKKEMTIAAGENEGIVLTRDDEQEDNNKAILGTPLPQSNAGDEIGASPIDIARAYMGSRKLGQGPGPYGDLPKAEGAVQLIEFASNSHIPSPTPKTSTCWPGSVVPEQRGYVTPLSQRGRYGLHDFPRTPYSRTMYSNSKAKLIRSQADSRLTHSSSNFFQQSQTPIYGKAKTRDDGFGSVGPIRRTRNKFASEARSRGSIFSKPLTQAASVLEAPNVSKGFLPTTERNYETGETSNSSKYQPEYSGARGAEEGNLLLTPSTSQAVRRILEHLDRTKPTPKEKAAELKLATSWRKPASSKISDDLVEATSSLSNIGDKKSDLASIGNYSRRNSDVQVRSSEIIPEAKNTVDSRVSVSRRNGDSGLDSRVSSGVKSIPDFLVQSSHESAFVGMSNGQKERVGHSQVHKQSNEQNFTFVPNASGFELPKKPATQSTGTRLNLSSIAINKRDPSRVVSLDNGFGFTFPVSASFGVLSEPPTPSFLPSSSPSILPPTTKGSAVAPSYSFGANESSPRLVFSFPATSSTVANNDTSEPKFKFGSDDKTRLSFKSIGEGVVFV